MPRLPSLSVLVLLSAGLVACAGDPRDAGITGPYPDGVQANTLTQNRSKADMETDSPGIGATRSGIPGVADGALSNSQYVPLLRPKSAAGVTGGRYFGYNY